MGNEALSTSSPGAESTNRPIVDYPAVQQSEQFQRLRRRQRSFVFPVLAICLAWYLAYVLLASYAHDFMSTPVWGSVNVAMVLGLAQVVTTFAVTTWYVSFANRRLDPLAGEIRDEIEEGRLGASASPAPAGEEVAR
ncbi:DUF485 domain-containing protein [Agromyces soli]